jgi:hypothetical protein
VETELHQLAVRVEKAFDQQETALGFFLHKERACNNKCYDTVCDALVRYESDYTILRWITSTLGGSIAVAKLNAFSMRLAKSRVCPQVAVF